MKTLLIAASTLLLLCAISVSGFGQVRDPDFQPKTLFSNIEHHGFYFAPTGHQAPVQKTHGFWLTYKLAYQMNHAFAIGAAGGALLSRHPVKIENDPANYKIGAGYGGLLLEYTIAPASLVHLSVPVVIGLGGVNYNVDNKNSPDLDYYNVGSDGFWIIEPGLQVEINLLRFLRLTCGANYRHVTGLNLPQSKNEDFSGFTGTIGFKVGIL